MSAMMVLLAVAFGCIVDLEGNRNARFLDEIDIEQEIINIKSEISGLKSQLSQKDAEITDLRNQIHSGLQLPVYNFDPVYSFRSSASGLSCSHATPLSGYYADDVEAIRSVLEDIRKKETRTLTDRKMTFVRKGDNAVPQVSTSKFGSTYIRWGRTTCPGNGTNLMYSGYMAGTYHNSSRGTAAGANYLCLAGQPTWDHYSETANNLIRVTGVEYQFWAHTEVAHDIKDYFGSDIHNSDAPCSVCRSQRSTSVMVPGRKDCYPGWTKEYSGYLVGGYQHYDDSTEYVCLDRRPEVVANSGKDYNDNKLYFVETFCGMSLECPPYVGNRELACVVCSM